MALDAFVAPASWSWRPSPNHNARPTRFVRPTGIVLHADASSTVASSLDWCRRPESKVSYHVLIGRRGDVYWLVHPKDRAWHAGASAWHAVADCNNYTVGVCLSNRNDGEPYPEAQVAAAVAVCAELITQYQMRPDRITTHALVALPAGRKTDPKGLDLAAFVQRVQSHRTTQRLAEQG